MVSCEFSKVFQELKTFLTEHPWKNALALGETAYNFNEHPRRMPAEESTISKVVGLAVFSKDFAYP